MGKYSKKQNEIAKKQMKTKILYKNILKFNNVDFEINNFLFFLKSTDLVS